MMACRHERVSGTEIYRYCEDCGAVRFRDPRQPGRWQAWHSCDLCRLPGRPKDA